MDSKNFRVCKGSIKAIGLACLAGALTACVIGQKISYSDTTADVAASGTETIALATWDQRPYVVSGDKGPTFVGLMRSGLGIPYNVNTKSGAPLTDDFSQSIGHSLDAQGFKTSVVQTQPAESQQAVMDALRAQNAQRVVLVTLSQWETDKYVHTTLKYQVYIAVYGSDGKEMTNQSFSENGPVGNVDAAFKAAITKWFSSPQIVAALK